MAKRKNPSRVNIPMCAAGVLLCLTLFSIHLTSGLYAKYTATATGSDSARVAKFEITTTDDSKAISVTTGAANNDSEYTFTIENQSEVAVEYTLSLKAPDNLPAGVGYTFQDDSFNSNSGQLAAGESADRTLTFSVDWNKFTADLSIADPNKEFTFTVLIDVEQID